MYQHKVTVFYIPASMPKDSVSSTDAGPIMFYVDEERAASMKLFTRPNVFHFKITLTCYIAHIGDGRYESESPHGAFFISLIYALISVSYPHYHDF